jgi:hypothetical protein
VGVLERGYHIAKKAGIKNMKKKGRENPTETK